MIYSACDDARPAQIWLRHSRMTLFDLSVYVTLRQKAHLPTMTSFYNSSTACNARARPCTVSLSVLLVGMLYILGSSLLRRSFRK